MWIFQIHVDIGSPTRTWQGSCEPFSVMEYCVDMYGNRGKLHENIGMSDSAFLPKHNYVIDDWNSASYYMWGVSKKSFSCPLKPRVSRCMELSIVSMIRTIPFFCQQIHLFAGICGIWIALRRMIWDEEKCGGILDV